MDILQILYDYAFEHRMARYLEESEAYHQGVAQTQQRQQNLMIQLNAEEVRRLRECLEDMERLHELKLEAMFRAGLSVGQELSRL